MVGMCPLLKFCKLVFSVVAGALREKEARGGWDLERGDRETEEWEKREGSRVVVVMVYLVVVLVLSLQQQQQRQEKN